MIRRQVSSLLLLSSLLASGAAAGCAKAGQSTASRAMDDATTTARVKTALLNDPNVTVARIEVETAKGVVTLSGQVKTVEERDAAIAAARRVHGVADVKSALQIQPGPAS